MKNIVKVNPLNTKSDNVKRENKTLNGLWKAFKVERASFFPEFRLNKRTYARFDDVLIFSCLRQFWKYMYKPTLLTIETSAKLLKQMAYWYQIRQLLCKKKMKDKLF